MKNNNYYLGLDIGTDSVGYAVTSESYDLLKFRGEPVWGATTFEAASLAEERRKSRTARRRLERKRQRVQLIAEIFAPEICKQDPNFFIRRQESALFREDAKFGVRIFDGGMTDEEYHQKYPTIHHLIFDLMNSDEEKDVRLVYLACAWLVAHRSHFLNAALVEQVGDFQIPYRRFLNCFAELYGCSLPWAEDITAENIQNIMQMKLGVKKTGTIQGKNISGKNTGQAVGGRVSAQPENVGKSTFRRNR